MMKGWLLVVSSCACILIGCASADGKGSAGNGGGASDKLTWTYVYTTYFGPGTSGHCGQSGCHGTERAGFVCASQAGCYDSITAVNARVTGRMVDPSTPGQSVLLDSKNSPLFWFNPTNGNMPNGALTANPDAVSDITAWVEAGAPND